ncbi:MAG: PGPGW domain-containing protein [Gammaproteobacteria bacterium]
MSYKLARRLVIGFFGLTVLLVGVAMIVLPGPAFIVIPVGLGILGIEFAWARRWLKTLKDRTEGVVEGLLGSSDRRDRGGQ